MPLTLTSPFADHIDQEGVTLATLWEIIRVDGVRFHYTDHDRDITFAGNLYKSGIGYDRTAIEDKGDLSSDNLNVKGVLALEEINRADIRAGLFDGAEVWIRIVNWENPGMGSIIRRRGWLGELKQNNLGQFDTELRGMTDALTENLSRVYTPGCAADLGSTDADNVEAVCNRKMVPDLRQDLTYYEIGQEVRFPGVGDLIFRATRDAYTGEDPYDEEFEYASIGDGNQVWEVFEPWRIEATVLADPTPDRRNFEVSMTCTRLDTDPRHFDGGLATFLTGENAEISREVKFVDSNSAGQYLVSIYLRMPFNVNPGDTLYLYPGCDKTIETCAAKFANAINFAGFPHIPGDNYLKDYPDAKR